MYNEEIIKMYGKNYYLKNKEKILKQVKRYKLQNLDKVKLRMKIYREKNKELIKKQQQEYESIHHTRLKRYNISKEEYINLLNKQNNKCVICKKIPNKKLGIDHCHKTGKIRGLLCNNCNSALGFLNDDMELVKNAYDYLILNR